MDMRAHFAAQANGCAKLGSPFMGQLMNLFAQRLRPGTPVADCLLNWQGDPAPEADSVPLRMAGALHALHLAGNAALAPVYPPARPTDEDLWSAVAETMETERDFILRRLRLPPQTNEVRRASALIPALHLLARKYAKPIRLIEIGCSAGLNLRLDHFRLQAGPVSYGPEDAEVLLSPDWTGPAPPRCDPVIVSRTGLDIRPLDPVADRARILSFFWPDQTERLERTAAAIRLATRVPARLVRSDAVSWLSEQLAPRDGTLTVLFHTMVWQYLSETDQRKGNSLIAETAASASASAPMARISMEAAGPHAALTLETWPDGHMIDLGTVDYHGRWIAWNPQSDRKESAE